MNHGAPARQDKPDTLPMLDEVLDLAPALQAGWAAERAALPPGTLVAEGEEDPAGSEEPGGGDPAGDPDTGQSPEEPEESFIDFDPSQIPEGTDPLKWVGEKYSEMRKAFTQKTMGISETRRKAEQSQALIEGLQDPETMPHYLRLMGIDLSDPQTLELLGAPGVGQADQELLDMLEDEPELEDRVGQLERERAEERQTAEAQAMEQALDDLADQELEKIEKAWDRELDEDEDWILRKRAEEFPGRDGLPDYESAAKTLKGFLSRRVSEELKRRSEPGRGAPGGRPGGKALDPNKDEDRLALGAAAAEQAMASQT